MSTCLLNKSCLVFPTCPNGLNDFDAYFENLLKVSWHDLQAEQPPQVPNGKACETTDPEPDDLPLSAAQAIDAFKDKHELCVRKPQLLANDLCILGLRLRVEMWIE